MAPATAYARSGAEDSEDDLASAAETTRAPGAKKTRAKATTARNTMMSAEKTTATKRKAAPKQSREALKDRTNLQSDTEEVENFEEEEMEAKPKAKRAKASTAATKKATTARASSEQPFPTAKGGRGRKAAANNVVVEPLGVIPETQPDPTEMEDVEESIEVEADPAALPSLPASALSYVPRARSTSVQPLQVRPSARSTSLQPVYPLPRERSASVSGQDREWRGGDPELRRKFNEMSRKHEDLSLKYQALQEIANGDADSNFRRLKKASEEKAKDASELIISLRKEIAELKKSSKSNTTETNGLQKQMTELKSSNEKVLAENEQLKAKAQSSQTELKTLEEKALTTENERKSLEAKLVAARQQITENSKVPGSAIKSTGRNTAANAAANAATVAQKEAKMKENLYADLTGLIIRGVKRKDTEDEYDCIQTGRNGTLHFHLIVANDTNPKTPSAPSYEDEDFAYEPFLDESRDRELIEILPDFLVDEISFPRNQAVRFYTMLVESMTKKIVVEDDE